jgi:putative ABC transport system substrate-binding protein
MRRRDFITLVGGATAWPVVGRAQQPAMPVIGFLNSGSPDDTYASRLAAFRQGLSENGFVEGRNVAIEYRWAEEKYDRLPALAADLVRRQVAVILATGGASPALAAKAATSTIPIVFQHGSDPIKLGLVASLSRPEGNVTGVTFITAELGAKRFDLLRQLVPLATTVGYLVDPRDPQSADQTADVLAAARALGRQVVVAEARSDRDFDAAFATFAQRRANALVVGAFPLFNNHRNKLVGLAANHRIPAIYQFREYALEGGLLSYGADILDAYRLGAVYVGKILKGAKPVELPIQQPTKFELIINLKTAKALRLEVPPALLASADEVIE